MRAHDDVPHFTVSIKDYYVRVMGARAFNSRCALRARRYRASCHAYSFDEISLGLAGAICTQQSAYGKFSVTSMMVMNNYLK